VSATGRMLGAGGIAVAYLPTAQLALVLLLPSPDITVFRPYSGIAAGILITSGKRADPALLISVVVGTVATNQNE
jgi:hypothetical protein